MLQTIVGTLSEAELRSVSLLQRMCRHLTTKRKSFSSSELREWLEEFSTSDNPGTCTSGLGMQKKTGQLNKIYVYVPVLQYIFVILGRNREEMNKIFSAFLEMLLRNNVVRVSRGKKTLNIL